ncbi:pyridoxamine 5'-phosphate oxidase family protein [Marinicella sediminis]|uniref:Pyridoxamine 5'-phosphate oxidase family protein n=1 Tax=Marinicella sediminis TaxID=1792834 RepID=A0ABV7J493_9GAMM|nr:pyridoxamine 5'-phosphate oxidase family protein [Marinicella sediminis]
MQVNDQLFLEKVKPLFSQAVYCSVATVDEAGEPHVSPIGSVVLKDKGSGWFFQKFTKSIPKNAVSCEYATLMAVNDGKWFWLKSLFKGRFNQPPALRIKVRLGVLRDATEDEMARFQRRVKPFRWTRGHALMWQDMAQVREFEIIEYLPVYIGQMTAVQFK